MNTDQKIIKNKVGLEEQSRIELFQSPKPHFPAAYGNVLVPEWSESLV